jgi:hypothetical protein
VWSVDRQAFSDPVARVRTTRTTGKPRPVRGSPFKGWGYGPLRVLNFFRDEAPNLPELYRRKVARLQEVLDDVVARPQAVEIVRSLISAWVDNSELDKIIDGPERVRGGDGAWRGAGKKGRPLSAIK